MKRRTFLASGAAIAGGALTAGLSSQIALALDSVPLTANELAIAARPETIAARQKIFGVDNVDPDTGLVPRFRVIISWITNSSFALAIAGRIVYCDTHITRLEVTPGRTPFVIKDLVDAAPTAILLGHGHFDHAENAAYLAAKTGATLYASEESCAAMRSDFARMSSDPLIQNDPVARFPAGATLNLVPVTSTGSTPGTQIVRLNFLEPFAQVIAFRHLHSVATPPDPAYPRNVFYPTDGRIAVDVRDAGLWPPGTALYPANNQPPKPGQLNLRTAGNPGAAVAIFYAITLRTGSNFSFAWNDTIGALREGKGSAWTNGVPADGQRIVNILKQLAPVNVYSAAVGTANAVNNGLRDLIDYQSALKPVIFVPNHQTTGGADVGETKSPVHQAIYLEQLRIMGIPKSEWPDVRWNFDRADYLKPMVFDAQLPDKRTNALRQAQLRNFDQYPYAENIVATPGNSAMAAFAVSDESAEAGECDE